MDVIVSRVVKEVDGGRERSGVFSSEGGLRAAFEDQFDEAFVVRVNDEDIQGKAPKDCV